jgi:D-erythro-7,8-dihydroneopterin triphosphate epimerase
VHTVIGTYEQERDAPRELRVNVSFVPRDETAAESDNLADGVDYAAVGEQVVALGKTNRFLLIEKFAGEVLKLVLAHPRVRSAEVEVVKPAALPYAESVSVTLSGENPEG